MDSAHHVPVLAEVVPHVSGTEGHNRTRSYVGIFIFPRVEKKKEKERTSMKKPTRASLSSSTIREISDLGAAAYLLTKGYPLVDLKRGARGYATFIFEVHEEVLLGYLRDDDPVPPRKFLDSLRALKGLAMGAR